MADPQAILHLNNRIKAAPEAPGNVSEVPAFAVPKKLWIDELHRETLGQLLERAGAMRFRVNPDKTRHHIVFDLLKAYAGRGTELFADGILELSPQGSGFLRWPCYNFRSLPQDVYVPAQVERQFFLRNGNRVSARIRAPRDREKFMTVDQVLAVEEIPIESWKETVEFDHLTALHPTERIILENTKVKSITPRAIDLIAPAGPRSAQPHCRPTAHRQDDPAEGHRPLHPGQLPGDAYLILLLVDERPTRKSRISSEASTAEIYSSTFDEGPARHTQVAEVVSERAKRLVELHKHVVILLDSITRLSRGYNNLQGNKGRTMSGGVDAKALVRSPRSFLAPLATPSRRRQPDHPRHQRSSSTNSRTWMT